MLVFVPLKYVYPSKLRVLRRTSNALAAVWLLLMVFLVLLPEVGRAWHLVWISLLYPAYYHALSFKLGGFHRRSGA